MRIIALVAAIIVSSATNVSAQNQDVRGHWVCTKQCGAGPAYAQRGLISERPDGTLVFYANTIPPGRYKDIAEGHWTGPDTIAIDGILGTAFTKVKWVRVAPGGRFALIRGWCRVDKVRMLTRLARAGLLTIRYEVFKAGAKSIEVVRIRITEAGRQAIES